MESENPFFCFPLIYGDEAVVCKAVMQGIGYDIYFDDRLMATLAHNEDFEWIQSSGTILPQTVIDEIGFNIESEYK